MRTDKKNTVYTHNEEIWIKNYLLNEMRDVKRLTVSICSTHTQIQLQSHSGVVRGNEWVLPEFERDNLVPIKSTVYKTIEAPQSVSYIDSVDINNVTNVLIIESVGIWQRECSGAHATEKTMHSNISAYRWRGRESVWGLCVTTCESFHISIGLDFVAQML